MPKRQYHNLDGLLRDGLACFQAEGDEAAWERLVALARFISDVLDVLDSSMDDDPRERGLTLRWTFETSETAHRWAELMRDMVPCAATTWDSLPGWETRWSVSVLSPARARGTVARPASWSS